MNLDQIALRISAPDSCLGQEIPALEALTEKYPFAQIFSILYLKALSNQNDVGFEEALQKHAYRVTDRMKLYDLIHNNGGVAEHIENDIVTEVISQEEAAHPDRISETTETEKNIENIPEEIKSEVISEEKEEIREEIIADTLQVEVEQPFEKTSAAEKEIETEPLQQEPAVEKTEAEVEKEAVTDIFKEREILPEEESLELEIISQVVATVYSENLENSIPEKQIEEKKSEEKKIQEPAKEKQMIETPRSFSSWLKAGTHPVENKEPEVAEEAFQSTEVIEKQIDKIIERFIEKEPSISRPKKEFYSPTKKAKESINPEGMIYTETLANIFAIQGNFPKAILAYEQLMLTNPEKKIFFALRIQELKEKLNT